MKKVLNITTDIPIKTYNNIAYPLSIIFGNIPDANDWLFTKSFRLKYGSEVSDITLNLPYNIDWDCFEKNIVKNSMSKDDIMDEILRENYVYLAVDEKFIPKRLNYQKKNFIHDILVYGFDDVQNSFYVIGFDEQQNYICQPVDYATLETAINSANSVISYNSFDYEFFGAGNNFSLKLKPSNCSVPTVDSPILQQLLLDFLKGDKFYSHTGFVCYSGIIIYEKMLQDEEALLDFRNWNILKEHKEFIFMYLQKHFPKLINQMKFAESINHVIKCLNLSIKYRFDKKESSRISLQKNTQILYELDKNIFEELLQNIILQNQEIK